MSTNVDIYEASGGDVAWQHWLDRCSVERVRAVDEKTANGLTNQVTSAMYAQLTRAGFSRDDVAGSDPVQHFDSFFLLNSGLAEKQRNKPLKQWLRHRMNATSASLKEMVCGMLFGSSKGRIRDIVRDWISTARGWKPHSVTQKDGTRKVIWECAAEKVDVRERSLGIEYRNIGTKLDRSYFEKQIGDAISKIAEKLKVEKSAVALLFYVTAKGISVDTPEVLNVLEVGKSRAYTLRTSCMAAAEQLFKGCDIATDDCMFARVLLKLSLQIMGEDVVSALSKRGVA